MQSASFSKLAQPIQMAARCSCIPNALTLSGMARSASHSHATPSKVNASSQEVTQQGQSFSQLKDSKKETTEVVFDPFEQGEEQMIAVAKGKLGGKTIEEGLARVFFHQDSEAAINEQINHELTMSYVYTAVGSYFNRDNVALNGFRDYFRAAADEERVHAQQLMDYQATRGGRVKLATLIAPESDYGHEEKGDALHSMEIALAMERLNLQYLYNLHEVAEKNGDGQFADFVEVMLEEQVNGVKECADFVSRLRRVGKGLGVYQFDAELQQKVASSGDAPAATENGA